MGDAMLAELLATDGVTERCELRSEVGFMALHGGLEAGTAEIADEAALRCSASLYTVEQPEGFQWHVPSHRYRLEDSQALESFCEHVRLVVSVHGYGGVSGSEQRWTTILLGGRARAEAAVLAGHLRHRLERYTVIADLEEMPRRYRGLHPDNPVNRVRGAGVQLELPPGVRGGIPIRSAPDHRPDRQVPDTVTLLAALVDAVTALRARS